MKKITKPKYNGTLPKNYYDSYYLEYGWDDDPSDFWTSYCELTDNDIDSDYSYYISSEGIKFCKTSDLNKIRHDKIDTILGINFESSVTFGNLIKK